MSATPGAIMRFLLEDSLRIIGLPKIFIIYPFIFHDQADAALILVNADFIDLSEAIQYE